MRNGYQKAGGSKNLTGDFIIIAELMGLPDRGPRILPKNFWKTLKICKS